MLWAARRDNNDSLPNNLLEPSDSLRDSTVPGHVVQENTTSLISPDRRAAGPGRTPHLLAGNRQPLDIDRLPFEPTAVSLACGVGNTVPRVCVHESEDRPVADEFERIGQRCLGGTVPVRIGGNDNGGLYPSIGKIHAQDMHAVRTRIFEFLKSIL
jgi:hypothetical protein